MHELADHDLLARYARDGSEPAFAALVERHVNLVYSVALRKIGNAHAAQEITQAVFILLARKAETLSRRTVLSGWLYQTARLTAANFLRTEFRRVRREQEAFMQSTLNEPESDTWKQIAPLLDDAMGRLSEKDRAAVVLRFFDGLSLREVGVATGVTESAAKVRIHRALEKLRKFFAARGVMLTTAIIAAAVSANSVQAAPAGLAATAAAAASGTLATGSVVALVNGMLKLAAWAKVKTALLAGGAVLLATGTTVVVLSQDEPATMWRVQEPTIALLRKTPPQVTLVRTRLESTRWVADGDKMLGIAQPAKIVLGAAYSMWATREVVNATLPPGRYDFIANLPQGSAEALQQEIKRQFGVVARRETRETNVLVLKVKTPDAEGLKPSSPGAVRSERHENGEYIWTQYRVAELEGPLGFFFNTPVVDETGLAGPFDYRLKLDWKRHDTAEVRSNLLARLGLELVPAKRKIEMLIVEPAKD